MTLFKKILGVMSVVVPTLILDAFAVAGEFAVACPPAAIAAIVIGGAVLGGIAGSGKGSFTAPDKDDLVPNAFRFLTSPSAEGGLAFKQLAQDELAFLDKAINMQLFDQVGQRGAAEIKRGFSQQQDAASRAAFFGIGPQAQQAGSFASAEAGAIADFQALLQKMNVGFAFEGTDRLNFLEGQAQSALGVQAGAQSIANAQPSSTSNIAGGVLEGAGVGMSIAGGFMGAPGGGGGGGAPSGGLTGAGTGGAGAGGGGGGIF